MSKNLIYSRKLQMLAQILATKAVFLLRILFECRSCGCSVNVTKVASNYSMHTIFKMRIFCYFSKTEDIIGRILNRGFSQDIKYSVFLPADILFYLISVSLLLWGQRTTIAVGNKVENGFQVQLYEIVETFPESGIELRYAC